MLTPAQRKKESTSIQNEARKKEIAQVRSATVVPVKHLLRSAGEHELQLMQLTERVRVLEGTVKDINERLHRTEVAVFGDN